LREKRRQRRRQDNLKNQTIIAVVVIAAIVVVVLIVSNALRKPVGESVEIMEVIDHFPDGAEIEYSTNPPTSGSHYSQGMPAGFYDEDSPEVMDIPYPVGHLVHNLEHGYVIIWYNCGVLDDAGCTELKSEIRALVAEESNKVIAFPWNNMAETVVLTSWGQILRMETFDREAVLNFIQVNRSHPRAPEPNAP
jgi:hypothetical protein